MSDADLLVSPVHDRHTALDATLGEFGGWSMPISYPDGTVAEHTAVRESAGLFDVSHLGTVPVTGPGAAAHLNACLTADLDRIEPGRAQYTMACTPDGGVLDDMIAYLSGPDDVLLVPNASNSSQIVALLRDGAPDGVEIVDRHRDLAVLAVQGPRSAEALRVALGAGAEVLDGLDYMAFRDLEAGAVRVCRSGYTGEHGYELVLEAAAAPPMWDALLDAVREVGGLPCGLAARDTLRTEMGYPLHGHELSDRISPLQANSGWAVGWDKPAFWGREALLAEKEKGPVRRLRALRATGRGVPRAGMSVLSAADGGDGARTIGTVTSGTFSPTLKTGIALALIDSAAGVGPGSEVAIEVRGRSLTAEVVKPPFVESHVR